MTSRKRALFPVLGATLFLMGACQLKIPGPGGSSSFSNGAGGSGTDAGTVGPDAAPVTKISVAGDSESPLASPPQACVPLLKTGNTALSLAVPGARNMASAELARGAVRLGSSLDPGRVRPDEFLNHYRTLYPGPTTTGKLAVHSALVPTGVPREYILQVGVETPDVQVPRHKVSAVTVVVDTSVSMALGGDQSGLSRARAAVTAIAKALRPGDTLNVVTSGEANLPTPIKITALGATDPAVQAAVERLSAGGGNDLAKAVANGYQLANTGFDNKALNRLVLITDGVVDDAGQVSVEVAAGYTKNNISIVAVGVGPAKTYDDSLLAAAAKSTFGANLYLDDTAAADELLDLRFDEVMDMAAANVQISISVPWFFEVEDLSGAGTAGSVLASSDLGPGRSLIFRQTLRVCDESILPQTGTDFVPINVTWSTSPDTAPMSDTVGASIDELRQADSFPVNKASAILAYAEALRGASHERMVYAHTQVTTALSASPSLHDADLEEIQILIEQNPIYLK